MNLKTGARAHKGIPIAGYDRENDLWVENITLGNIRTPDLVPQSEDLSRRRVLACSDLARIPGKYRLIRFPDSRQAIIETESASQWRGGVYEYLYQIRFTAFQVDAYEFVQTQRASGVPGGAVRTLRYSVPGDIVFMGTADNTQADTAVYARTRLFIPGDVEVHEDYEFEIDGQTYDAMSYHRSPLAWDILTVRRSAP